MGRDGLRDSVFSVLFIVDKMDIARMTSVALLISAFEGGRRIFKTCQSIVHVLLEISSGGW